MKGYLIIEIKNLPERVAEEAIKGMEKPTYVMTSGIRAVGEHEVMERIFRISQLKEWAGGKIPEYKRKVTRVSFDEKVSFVKEYNDMFANLDYKNWDTGMGSKGYWYVKRIANNARSRFGYSQKTGDADIVGRLMNVWLKIKK